MIGHLNDVAARVPQSQREVLPGPVAVQTAAVGVRLPTHRPACHVAVAGNLPVVGCLEQTLAFGALVEGADLREGIEAHQVREVAVRRVRECVVLPFRDAELAAVSLCPKPAVEVVVEVTDGCYLRGCEGRLVTKLPVTLHHLVQQLVACLLRESCHVVRTMLRTELVLDFVQSFVVLCRDGLDEECTLVHDG